MSGEANIVRCSLVVGEDGVNWPFFQKTIYLKIEDTFLHCTLSRRGSRISARGGRQGNDDLIWGGNERFLTYANTDLQLFNMFIAILCLNGVEQPFKRHQCPFFLPLRRESPRFRRGSFRPRGGRPPQRPPPWIRACSQRWQVWQSFYFPEMLTENDGINAY